MERPNRGENERVLFGTGTGREVGLSEGVLGLGAVGEHHDPAIAAHQQQDGEQEQQQQQAREAPHPVDAFLWENVAALQADRQPRIGARFSVHGVGTTGLFLIVGKTVVVVVGVFG